MKNKEFRHLNRAELVEIIYQLQQDNLRLQEENTDIMAKLASKEIKISEAGSIAEAVIGLSDIFAKAQEAADDYLMQIHRSNADVEHEYGQIIADAQSKANDILRKAEYAATLKLKTATEESEKRWREVNAKIEQLLKSHEALKGLLR